MKKMLFTPVVPLVENPDRKYDSIYKKPRNKKEAPTGDISLMQAGDIVSYIDDRRKDRAEVSGVVEKVNTAAGVLRIAPHIYNGKEIRNGRSLIFAEVLGVQRRRSTEQVVDSPAV